ncbi:uncharacterized protein LOC111811402 [Cucurbita pepo subsp. pepo]|uniref:uncharacterized protein LOC111811402 n=1 Tax=Cucurbita pepo subsp. pepo TaxID=3664 RepID=UPI000C9D4A89|nr:uncharacterized protein LOC111811402 [Cucurbita pepo subsp. pepo]
MLEDQVAYLLQRYLGNYVRGLNKEALKISVWQGDVELTNMQLKPEALNALKLPVKVKAGFLGSVKIKVPWSRLGQDPVIVYLDRIFLLAEPATEVEGHSEEAIQEVKKARVREMEIKLLERMQRMKTEMNNSWLGSLISTIIGNLKLSISNIHVRYEDIESNPGHPFAAGVSLEKLSAVTVDDDWKETFITGGALDRIHKFVELNQLAVYLDCDISPWYMDKPWEDLLPSEWDKVFRFGTKNGKPAEGFDKKHSYILQPVSGYARYTKLRENDHADSREPLQKASVYLDDVTLCLSKNGYRDILKLVDNFSAFNQRLKYAHFRPHVSVKTDPRSWWKYAFNSISDQLKKGSGKMTWEQVLKFANLRKRYISLYASLLKSDPTRAIVDDDIHIEELDRELDIELILQWRMLAHKFVQKTVESDQYLKKTKAKKSWWSFGWNNQSFKDEEEQFFSQEDWEQLNKFIGYKEEENSISIINASKEDALLTSLEVHMNRNASKLTDEAQHCLAELSCKNLNCSMKFFPETKVFDINLGSYQLSSPSGLLAVSAATHDSLVGIFCYKPFDVKVDWSLVVKASPCYMTYLKDVIEQILSFFESSATVGQTVALETAAALQMTIEEVKRTAQLQVNRALKDRSRFLLDLDIAAPKITIPAEFHLDDINSINLLIDLGNLLIRTQDEHENVSPQELDMYLQFDVVLSDVSAFLVDGDYNWNQIFGKDTHESSRVTEINILPVIDKCGVILTLQQIRLENPSYPSTRLAVRLPSLGFHFSPARYHRLLKILKIFQGDNTNSDVPQPWNQADFEGWLSVLIRKGVGNREAEWQLHYCCLVGPYLYLIESPGSKSYNRYISLRGKQTVQLPAELVGDVQHVLAVHDASRSNIKVVEDASALILRCDSDVSRKIWQNRLQGAIYRASASAPILGLSETSSNSEDSEVEPDESDNMMDSSIERVFLTGSLDELKVCFSSSNQHDQDFEKVLLAEERHLIEFRAIGGLVELSIRSDDMFIGTILKSLEIEDLVCSKTSSQSCYLARSFVHGEETPSFFDYSKNKGSDNNDSTQIEGDEKFFEAPETLVDYADYQMQSPGKGLDYVKSRSSVQLKNFAPPSFSRIAGLLPPGGSETHSADNEQPITLDNFVKAQIAFYDQNSPRYYDVDKQVSVTLATLSFFCRRPTVLALIEFANAINLEEESCESLSDNSSSSIIKHNSQIEEDEQIPKNMEDGIVKGLLGKGRSRVVFSLELKMARAQIFLVKENESNLASLFQDNLLANIKVFPSSFSIEAALGNLRISDDSLSSSHIYYWACDMRNPGGSSFVELFFSSYNVDDEDYNGYEYSLLGKLSEVRVVYLNRFIQEVVSYFVGLVPENAEGVVKLKDQVTNSEKWFTTTEIEGSPALKLDLSLSKPIILMPRRTDSLDYLKLDIVHITIQNTFQWISGSKTDMSAVHLEILTVMIDDINLNVAVGAELGESIIEDVKGVSVVVRRSLRDLLHQIPSLEVGIQIEVLKAVLSNREYQIITECAMSNISETANVVPPLKKINASSADIIEPATRQVLDGTESETSEPSSVSMKLSINIDLVQLSLRAGISGDASLATVQANKAWVLYNSNTNGEGFLSATLKDFTVLDERDGIEQEFRRAIGIANSIGTVQLHIPTDEQNQFTSDASTIDENVSKAVPTMLILDAKFTQFSTFVSLSVQKPQLLVALDFLLAVVEFFVPTVGSILSDEEDKSYFHVTDAVILDQSPYMQPSSELHISPGKLLVADDENIDHFIYDGNGGVMHLTDRNGVELSAPSKEAMIYVGNGKKLQFKNIIIKGGQFLDSCVFMGTNSSYSASKQDEVYLELGDNVVQRSSHEVQSQDITSNKSTEYTIELQAIGPELIFYNTSREVGESTILQNQLLHAQLDVFCRFLLKGDTTEFSANALGLTMESNGIRILEPFDTSVHYSNASGKTNIHLSVSDIFMNFSFSILRLFLAVEEDIVAFLRMTSKKMTVVCSQFDKVGTIKSPNSDQVYSFWRPNAPPGFAILGDYVTPSDKPPTKGVLAVNTSFARVKRPISFRLIWPPVASQDSYNYHMNNYDSSPGDDILGQEDCFYSIWFPEAPKGYVALGCVVSKGIMKPPLSAVFCIATSLVSGCSLRDCISISTSVPCRCRSNIALWRVDNAAGSFLPADPTTFSVRGTAYELRRTIFGFPEVYLQMSKSSDSHASPSQTETSLPEKSRIVTSGQHFEAVADFQLIWWNRGSNSKKKLSIWRPVVPQGKIYFGDVVMKGFERPNTSIILNHTGDEELYKTPLDFQLVGQIKKQKGMEDISFWLPQAPAGFVSLGCIACKCKPKQQDFSALGCVRMDMVAWDQFLEESAWDFSDARLITEPFSIWIVGNELGTFIVRSGSKRPQRSFNLKLVDSHVTSGSDNTVIDAEVRTFSIAVFDDYAGLMVPLFNISLSGLGFSLHGRKGYLNSVVNFFLAARSYNDKYESWEPLVEPVDGFLRYHYNQNSTGSASQLHLTSARDLNLNISASNINMLIQAYASWINLTNVQEHNKTKDSLFPTSGGKGIGDVQAKRDYFIIPQNKLGQDIYIRATEIRGLQNVIRMPSGDMKPLKVPVSKNMLDSHLEGKHFKKDRRMVTIIISGGQLPKVEGPAVHQYTVAIRLTPLQGAFVELQHQQSARTSRSSSNHSLSAEVDLVFWNEIFFFKIESPEKYMLELMVIDVGKGDATGFFSAPLTQIAQSLEDEFHLHDHVNKLSWIELASPSLGKTCKFSGKLSCTVLLSPKQEFENINQSSNKGRKSGSIQISPSRTGPWTTVRLNYATPAACWRLGNDVIASQVTVKDGSRYVTIRSLVSVQNNTDYMLDVCLMSKHCKESIHLPDETGSSDRSTADNNMVVTEEFDETEKYSPTAGWVSCLKFSQDFSEVIIPEVTSRVELPSGWEWIDDWHLDKRPHTAADGWVYAPDVKSLKWPDSSDSVESVNHARQRRWVRSRKQISNIEKEIFIGQLKPGDTVPLPLSVLAQSGRYIFHLRPSTLRNCDEYSWSSVVDKPNQEDANGPDIFSEVCVSNLSESEELLYCVQTSGTSSSSSHRLWFCLGIQASEIAKDMHSDPIQDWNLVIKAPLSITNYLPLVTEFSVLHKQKSGHFIGCCRGILHPGKTVKVYDADIRNPLFFSLFPQRGWLPVHETVLISHPHGVPARTLSLRSSITGRVVQVILEQNHSKEHPFLEKIIRFYAPYWFSISRCPPLTLRLVDRLGRKDSRKIYHRLKSKTNTDIFEEITDEEIHEGYTIASALNFNSLGLSVSINQTGKNQCGDVKELSPLGDMDGSLDLYACDDEEGKRMQLFISTKPCPYPSVPTKVISVRPFMTFTNRLGHDIFIKLSDEDETKVLHPCDSRMSFAFLKTDGHDKFQVRLEDTSWSLPFQITEDTIFLALRRYDGTRRFLRIEVRGYEEGSRYIIVFRVGSADGPIRVENRTGNTINLRQSGFGEEAWILLPPLSTTNFCWEDPYSQHSLDTRINNDSRIRVWKLNTSTGFCSLEDAETELCCHVAKEGDINVVRFRDRQHLESGFHEEIGYVTAARNWRSQMQRPVQDNEAAPTELIVELGVVGISIIDHKPKELAYMYLERVFISYSTGFDGGTTNRFEISFGNLQLDNQLPLTLMPVLLAPEQTTDRTHPAFGLTITIQNENIVGIRVFPYICVRVTEKSWRLNIHEPVIWAVVDLYNNLQLGRLPQSSSITQADPEIRINLIEISEVKLKVVLEPAPAQRPHGVLGIWSPILSAVGNAFKIQVHLRRVMRRDRYMRESSILPAIGNRIWRDFIHNPLHLIFSLDVLGMTSSTLASLSKGFAELSTDGQFLQLRSKQVWSRRITGVRDGIIQGTEALAQGVAFGVSGVVTKPVESARQNGLIGLAHGLGRAFLGFIVQPVSGALDFFSLTVDGIGASCSKCLEVFSRKVSSQRVRNPRAIHADSILREYCDREALGQMVLHLAEGSTHFGCTEIFKEPSKFAFSDYYEEHFIVPYQRIVLVTNKRVMLLQCSDPGKLDKKPCKILWDVPWEELMALELAKVANSHPSHLIIHLKTFKRSENFARVIKCHTEEIVGREPQAVRICSVVRKLCREYQSDMKCLVLKVPSSQRHVYFSSSEADGRDANNLNKSIIRSRELLLSSSLNDEGRFVKRSMNFTKVWSSDLELKGRCILCKKQALETGGICTIWRPICPDGYVSIGDIAHLGSHPPNVAAIYRYMEGMFAPPVGYDLVWRNCQDDYITPVSIWHPRAPEGFVSPGCVAVADFAEPGPNVVYCVAESLAEETVFEEQKIWSAPDAYPWACHIYQMQSDALHFVALRQSKEESDWKPMRVLDQLPSLLPSSGNH